MVGTDKNLAQTAIAFCLSYDAVSTVIPGNINVEQLVSNVQSTHINISKELKDTLEIYYQTEVKNLSLPW
jgi:aryl-alcohol dehydrogenase-like predicted oxidoreductase